MTSSSPKSVDHPTDFGNADQRSSSSPIPMTRALRAVNQIMDRGTPSQPRHYRADTEATHQQAVERALSSIRQRFAEGDIGISMVAAEHLAAVRDFCIPSLMN